MNCGESPAEDDILWTVAGVTVAFGLPLAPLLPTFLPPLVAATGMSGPLVWGIVVTVHYLATPICILLIVSCGERQPLASVGVRRPSSTDFCCAVAAVALYECITAAIHHLPAGSLVSANGSPTARAGHAALAALPFGIRALLVVGASLAEEVGARAYAIERFAALGCPVGGAAALAYLCALLMHVPYWGLSNVVMFVPGQLMFVLLYAWRRNVAASVIAHILVDGFPLIVWPQLPLALRRYLLKLGF
jgi:membrane protease YdiL (CAAX protease family)